MTRALAAAALLVGVLWAGACEPAEGKPGGAQADAVLVRVGDFRVTRAQFDRRHEAALARVAGDPDKERSLRAQLASDDVQVLLLADYARKNIVRDEGLLGDIRRNAGNEYIANEWLEARLAKTEGDAARREKALSIVAKLSKKVRVRLRLPLLGREGSVPPDDRVVADLAKEQIRFRRVRALLSMDYRRFAAWPGKEDEESLRKGLEAVVRLELVARAARAEKKGSAGDPAGEEWFFRERLKDLAVGGCREEASRPDPETDAKVKEKLPPAPEDLHPLKVIVFKGADRKDVADFQKSLVGLPTDNPMAGSRMQEVKFRRAAEYWLPKRFLPLPVELAALAVPPGQRFSEIVFFSGEYYLVHILERGEPPRVDLEAERKRLEAAYAGQKFQEILKETVRKARAGTEVEVSQDLL